MGVQHQNTMNQGPHERPASHLVEAVSGRLTIKLPTLLRSSQLAMHLYACRKSIYLTSSHPCNSSGDLDHKTLILVKPPAPRNIEKNEVRAASRH